MSANVEAMIREGINAYRAGNREESRTLLLKAVELDEHNEQAWMWLSAVVDTPEDQQTCLENVLTINPNNEKAKQGLRILSQKTAKSASINMPSSTPVEEEEDPFANISFTQSAPSPAPTAGPFSAPDIPDEEELPSLDWDAPATETSSASSYRPVKEPTPRDYDDWVVGLNLGGGSASSIIPEPPPTSASNSSPFVMNDSDNLFGFDDDNIDLPESIKSAAPGPFDMSDDFDEPVDYPPEPMSSRSFATSPSPAFTPQRKSNEDFLADIEKDEPLESDLLEDYDQAEMADVDPQEFFKHIPNEIGPTRLPGVQERAPILALLVLLVLVGANGAAIYLLFQTLTKT
jgi:hypothetical protein